MNYKSPKFIVTALLVFLTPFLIANPKTALSQEQRGLKVTAPDNEMRSSIHAVDGYAYLANNMTITDIRAAALADAK